MNVSGSLRPNYSIYVIKCICTDFHFAIALVVYHHYYLWNSIIEETCLLERSLVFSCKKKEFRHNLMSFVSILDKQDHLWKCHSMITNRLPVLLSNPSATRQNTAVCVLIMNISYTITELVWTIVIAKTKDVSWWDNNTYLG